MKTDKDTIQYIARMAKLKFTEEEMDRLSADFGKILEHFQIMDKEVLSGVDFNPESGEKAVFREDKVEKFENREELLQNTKQMRDGFIIIPKVLE